MRIGAYIAMVLLVVGAVASGNMALALAVGGAKTAIVGVEFMELRQAARPHMVAFLVGTMALTVVLVALTRAV
jgi:hypothetical protein